MVGMNNLFLIIGWFFVERRFWIIEMRSWVLGFVFFMSCLWFILVNESSRLLNEIVLKFLLLVSNFWNCFCDCEFVSIVNSWFDCLFFRRIG